MNYKAIKNYIYFLAAMTSKELKGRYKSTSFGFLWVVLNPLLQMIIIGFVFSFFIKIPNYFLFLFTGLLPWQFFSLSLSKATPILVFERALLFKSKFSVETIPLSVILANFFHLIVSFLIFIPILWFFVGLKFSSIFLALLLFIWLFLLTFGLSLFTAALNVRFRDVSFFVQSVLSLWFYATPIMYSLNNISSDSRNLYLINPLTTIFELLHIVLTGQGTITKEIVFSNVILSVLIVLSGVIVWRRERKNFTDWL